MKTLDVKTLSLFALATMMVATSAYARTEGDVTEEKLDGMTVIVKRIPAAELATAQLYVRGGSRNWTKADAGIEQMAFRVAATGGTTSLDKVAFGQKLASLGGTLWADTGRDWSMMQTKGPLASFDALFGLMASALLEPALPASEIEVARDQQVAAIRHQDEDPDGKLDLLMNQALFKGHPYEHRPEGTLDVVQKLTRDQLAAHLAKVREKSRFVLVVVGDVDPKKVVADAKAAFVKVPKGKYVNKPLPKITFPAATLVTEERKLPTNYIEGMHVGAQPGTKEFAAMIALMSALRQRLFEEVRTKRNLSYAPGTRAETTEAGSFGGIYVTATDPNTTLKVMLDELKRVQTTPLSDEELAGTKATTRTNMLMNLETTGGQAGALARAYLLTGDWRNHKKLVDNIAALTAADLQSYAKRRMSKLQVVMLGDPKQLDEKLAKSF